VLLLLRAKGGQLQQLQPHSSLTAAADERGEERRGGEEEERLRL
jgi:hypothetical protein